MGGLTPSNCRPLPKPVSFSAEQPGRGRSMNLMSSRGPYEEGKGDCPFPFCVVRGGLKPWVCQVAEQLCASENSLIKALHDIQRAEVYTEVSCSV